MVGDLADLNAVPLLIGCLCFDDVILAKQKEQKKDMPLLRNVLFLLSVLNCTLSAVLYRIPA